MQHKGCDNVIVDCLPRVVKTNVIEEETEVAENFPDEYLFQLSFQSPWYADSLWSDAIRI